MTRTILRPQRVRLVPVEMTVQEKKLDDDLPAIATAYQRFLKTGRVEA